MGSWEGMLIFQPFSQRAEEMGGEIEWVLSEPFYSTYQIHDLFYIIFFKGKKNLKIMLFICVYDYD